ncbi:hypothetical protein [Sinomonas soli]
MPRPPRRPRQAGPSAREHLLQEADVIIHLGGGSLVGAGKKLTVEESERALDAMREVVEAQLAAHEAHPASPDE